MAILTQQQAATFPIRGSRGNIYEEIDLWQPEEATMYWSPTPDTAASAIPQEPCPWTDEMVQELWCRMIQETENKMILVEDEAQGWTDLDELVKGSVIDINEPSYFNEWDQSTGRVAFVCDARGIAQKFTPEILVQRDNLNWLYNSRDWSNDVIADHIRELEVVSLGDNFGLAKCDEGAVFIPKSTLKHIRNVVEKQQEEYYNDGSLAVGSKFEAWITFTGGKYPWRVTYQGVTNIY